MLDTAAKPGLAVTAKLNFPQGRAHKAAAVWSNTDENLIDQDFAPLPVEIRDARALEAPPSLQEQGFTLIDAPLTDPRWADADWRRHVYVPSCVELVRRLTGASEAMSLVQGDGIVLMRAVDATDRQGGKASLPARFVHLDQTVEHAEAIIGRVAGDSWRARYGRAVIYNVWRSISAPPQNTPLALCDQRSVDREKLFVPGSTQGSAEYGEIPYLSTEYSPAMRWCYFPGLQPHEAIVFKGVDSDRSQPFGCLHSAFDLPDPTPGAPPRRSCETRVLTLFET
jgi:hypothetical protein